MKTTTQAKQAASRSKAAQGHAPQEEPLTHVGGEEEGDERCAGTLREEEGKDAEQVTGPVPR